MFGVGISDGPTYDQLGAYQRDSTIPVPIGDPSMGPRDSSTPEPITGYQPTSDNTPIQPQAPYYGGTIPSPAAYQTAPQQFNQPGYATGAPTSVPVSAPVQHRAFQDYMPGGSHFGELISDPTYQIQKSALLAKLGDYERNVAGQVGSQNLSAITNSTDPLTGSSYGWNGRALGQNDLFHKDIDQNGDIHYSDAGQLGGTLDQNFRTALGNFDNNQAQGLRDNAENFAARGMLGSGSGVWQTARNNMQDQYNTQLGNLTGSTVNQYNNILAGLNDQFSQGRNALQGYAGDASNRMAQQFNSGLPTSVQ